MAREKLGSRLGFILLSAGCAIGVGNVWKFPYICGQNGGGIFVLFYVLFLLMMGIPVLTMEFATGRASQKSPIKMHSVLAPKEKIWKTHGYAAFGANYLLLMFYSTVTGWILNYVTKSVTGEIIGKTSKEIGNIFDSMLADPWAMVIFMGIVVLLSAVVCSFKLQGGLERVTKYMMIALIVIMLALAINSLFQDGAIEGIKFYLLPDVERASEAGWGNVIVSAMNQAFFTLSLGIGSMAIFGSYIGKDRSLMNEAVTVTALDTFVAFSAGLIVIPACFAYDIPVNAGPSLLFITLPQIFNNMPFGQVWAVLFFVFMSFAALSTMFAVFENMNAMLSDITGWSRKKTSVINCVALFVLSLPCALGFNLLKDFQPFEKGSTVLDLEDFIVSNIMLPLGSLAFVLFCVGKKRGWKWDNYFKEVNTGKGLKIKSWMRCYCKYVLPVIIVALFIIGIVEKINTVMEINIWKIIGVFFVNLFT